MTDTRGTGVLNRIFSSWEPFKGSISGRRRGVLISMETGKSVAYAIFNLEDRGKFFIGAGEDVIGTTPYVGNIWNATSAIANAIQQALGKRIEQLPMTPTTLLEKIGVI